MSSPPVLTATPPGHEEPPWQAVPQPLPDADTATAALAAQVRAERALLAYPDSDWVQALATAGTPVHDVLVVGAGQSGLGICAALRAQGITRVLALERAAAGDEGVWEQFARMPELRTPKALNGLDGGMPALSVQRWYPARFGQAAWDRLHRVPRSHWMQYLRWYRETLQLPVRNGVEVLDIGPSGAAGAAATTPPPGPAPLAVDTLQHGQRVRHLARLVVLATGTEGGGAWRVPGFLRDALPAQRCHHSCDAIDFGAVRGERVAILGHGASAFDNAVAALQAGAAAVDLCFRRARLPRVNPHRHIETAGLLSHYARLSDRTRWQVALHFREVDQPPPSGSFRQALADPRFALHPGRAWHGATWTGREIRIDTAQGPLQADRVICATGQVLDLGARPELQSLAPVVARWADRLCPPADEAHAGFGAYPYLGEHYEFLPRHAGSDFESDNAWVTQVFAFNGSSAVSHGPHSTSISGHKYALPRLVRGVAQRLFLDQERSLLDRLRAYATTDLDLPDDFEARWAGRSRQPDAAEQALAP